MNPKCILAFESSCDDSSVALVDERGEVLLHEYASQTATHKNFGGVVPEVASRAHIDVIPQLASRLILDWRKSYPSHQVYKVAATCGPGLVGPLLVGKCFAEALATGWQVGFIGVHHLRGHLASLLLSQDGKGTLLTEKAQELFPALVVLVSGGHTQILWVEKNLSARALADTTDDAAGECFDKSAKLMGLDYPGGPAIEMRATRYKTSDPSCRLGKEIAAHLPRPKSVEGFSFSGLKTAIRLLLEKNPEWVSDDAFAWAVQEAIADTLVKGIKSAVAKLAPETLRSTKTLALCGGVSANHRIRSLFDAFAKETELRFVAPPLKYCTDNAAMIAAAAWLQKDSHRLNDVHARVGL